MLLVLQKKLLIDQFCGAIQRPFGWFNLLNPYWKVQKSFYAIGVAVAVLLKALQPLGGWLHQDEIAVFDSNDDPGQSVGAQSRE